jgi:hypothetical protein
MLVKFSSIAVMVFLILFSSFKVFGQLELPKSSDGDYSTVLLLNLSNKADSGFSRTYKIPHSITQAVFEVAADTISASDSLIVTLQGSPTGKAEGPWFTIYTLRSGTSGEVLRQYLTNTDRYIRCLYQCKGSAISNDFRCFFTPKR